jgi:hypothetical protein
MKFFFHVNYTPLFIFNESMWTYNLKVVLASLKVAFATSTAPSLEIPSYS